MIPKAFEYLVPKTLPEAISMLQQHGNTAKIMAGGHSLIPMMKFRQTPPDYVIDINKISGLDYIKESEGYLRIGALTSSLLIISKLHFSLTKLSPKFQFLFPPLVVVLHT